MKWERLRIVYVDTGPIHFRQPMLMALALVPHDMDIRTFTYVDEFFITVPKSQWPTILITNWRDDGVGGFNLIRYMRGCGWKGTAVIYSSLTTFPDHETAGLDFFSIERADTYYLEEVVEPRLFRELMSIIHKLEEASRSRPGNTKSWLGLPPRRSPALAGRRRSRPGSSW